MILLEEEVDEVAIGNGASDKLLLEIPVRAENDVTRIGFILFYGIKKGVRIVGVKDFVAVHHCDEIFGIVQINDIMSVPRKHVYRFNLVSAHLPLQHLAFWIVQIALLNKTMARDHDKELPLGVVPVLAFGDVGL